MGGAGSASFSFAGSAQGSVAVSSTSLNVIAGTNFSYSVIQNQWPIFGYIYQAQDIEGRQVATQSDLWDYYYVIDDTQLPFRLFWSNQPRSSNTTNDQLIQHIWDVK